MMDVGAQGSSRARRMASRSLGLLAVAALVTTGILSAGSTLTLVSESDAWKVPAGQQRGLSLLTWEHNGYAGAQADEALFEIASLGAEWVEIVPTWYQQKRTSNEIAPTFSGPDDENIRSIVQRARNAGLKILLKPHVDLLDGSDRAAIQPADRHAWFTSYKTFILHYANIAAELGVEEFAVGTELHGLVGERDQWSNVIDAVRDVYPGPITYAANHYDYEAVTFWDKVDIIGINAWWPIASEPTRDVSTLKRALVPIRDELAALSARYGRPILFTEAGYASQQGTTTFPGYDRLSGEEDQAEQAAGYEALLETFSDQTWWIGVHWWLWTVLSQGPTDPPPELDHSVRGKEAEAVLRRWWRRS
jgi:glycosyl hydrolase family 113